MRPIKHSTRCQRARAHAKQPAGHAGKSHHAAAAAAAAQTRSRAHRNRKIASGKSKFYARAPRVVCECVRLSLSLSVALAAFHLHTERHFEAHFERINMFLSAKRRRWWVIFLLFGLYSSLPGYCTHSHTHTHTPMHALTRIIGGNFYCNCFRLCAVWVMLIVPS